MNKLVSYICRIVARVLKKTNDENFINIMMEFIKFGIIGVSSTLVSYGVNVMTLFILAKVRVEWDYIIGNVFSFLISVLWSFFWNNRVVFVLEEGEERSVVGALIKTYVSYAFTGLIVCNILSWIWVDILKISKYIAPLINSIINLPLNFIINKLWAFKKKDNF